MKGKNRHLKQRAVTRLSNDILLSRKYQDTTQGFTHIHCSVLCYCTGFYDYSSFYTRTSGRGFLNSSFSCSLQFFFHSPSSQAARKQKRARDWGSLPRGWLCSGRVQRDMSIVGHQAEAVAADSPQFRPFTRQSLANIEARIAEREAKRLAEEGDQQVRR